MCRLSSEQWDINITYSKSPVRYYSAINCSLITVWTQQYYRFGIINIALIYSKPARYMFQQILHHSTITVPFLFQLKTCKTKEFNPRPLYWSRTIKVVMNRIKARVRRAVSLSTEISFRGIVSTLMTWQMFEGTTINQLIMNFPYCPSSPLAHIG